MQFFSQPQISVLTITRLILYCNLIYANFSLQVIGAGGAQKSSLKNVVQLLKYGRSSVD